MKKARFHRAVYLNQQPLNEQLQQGSANAIYQPTGRTRRRRVRENENVTLREIQSLARNPFAGFLELSQDFFQFRKRKNDKWTPHPDAALFSEANKPPAISM